MNQVVSKRMVKKQQMRWSESGAHNLLQVRAKVLNDQLRETFVRWYPAMQTEQETETADSDGPALNGLPVAMERKVTASVKVSEIACS